MTTSERRPAADWEREALPIGNGSLGATIFGGAPSERIQLNERRCGPVAPARATGTTGDWAVPRPGALAGRDTASTRAVTFLRRRSLTSSGSPGATGPTNGSAISTSAWHTPCPSTATDGSWT